MPTFLCDASFFYIDCCFQLLSSFNLESQSDEKKFPSEEKEVSLFSQEFFTWKVALIYNQSVVWKSEERRSSTDDILKGLLKLC